MRRRRATDPDGMAAYMRQWRAENRETIRASKTAWEAANSELVRSYARRANRKWRQANVESVRKYNSAWAAANPDKVAAQDRRWRVTHPEAVRALKARRRALIRGATIGDVNLLVLWDEQSGICALCDCRIDPDLAWPDPMSRSLDHIVPLARGGAHEQTNLAWTHLFCNLSKGVRMPE